MIVRISETIMGLEIYNSAVNYLLYKKSIIIYNIFQINITQPLKIVL